jgi:hypothetical protein
VESADCMGLTDFILFADVIVSAGVIFSLHWSRISVL